MKWLRKSAIRSGGIILLVFIIGMFSVYAFASYDTAGNFFEKNSMESLYGDADIISSEIESMIGRYDVLVRQMATNRDFRMLASETLSRETKREHPLYGRVVEQLIDIKTIDESIELAYIASGKIDDIIADIYEHDSPQGFDLEKRPWYIDMVRAQKTNLSEPYRDARTGTIAVTIASPLYEGGDIMGAVAINIMIDDIYRMMREYKVGENGYIVVMNKSGRVIYHPDEDISEITEIEDLDPDLAAMKGIILSGESGVMEYEAQDGNNYLAYVPVDYSNLVVAAIISKSEAMMPVQQIFNQNLIILLAVTAALAAFIMTLTSRITRPLVELSEEIEYYGKAGLRMKIPEKFFERTDEIGTLANGLDFMSRSIDRHILEMGDRNKELFSEIETRKTVQMRLEMILKLLSGSSEGNFILNDRYECIYSNRAFEKLAGYEASGSARHNLLEQGIIINQNIVDALSDSGRWSGDVVFENESKEKISLYLNIRAMDYDGEVYYTGNTTDLTRFRQVQRDIHRLKNFDSLTKLYNKDYFEFMVTIFLESESSDRRMHSMILVNIDNFRLINEARGFEFGSEVLAVFSRKLMELAGEKDIVARLGNDEFAVFRTGLESYEQLYRFIVEFSREINNYHRVSGEEMFVSVTMGISVYPSDGESCQELLKNATSALNSAKSDTSMDFEFYNKEISSQSVYKYELKNMLRYAMEKTELTLHYQPQIDMVTKKIKGIEALLRWNHDGEMIPPDKFIPVAEEYNLILPVGEWVLREACRFGNELYRRGHEIQIAVNLSRMQFKNPYIVSLVSSVLGETGLPPHLLELEITESILMDNEEECERILKSFRAMGIKTAIDDFGTGYSSLSYLKKFAVDRIKIDRTFIKEIPEKDDGAIAKVIIELATVLHIDVLAEGVETEKQMDFLVKNSCSLAQGYLFSRPLSEEVVTDFIEKNAESGRDDASHISEM